jgi:dihydroorotate dehydrogenase
MKRDLYFSKPLMNAAGFLGFAPDFRSLGDFGSLFGAFVTNPISLRPRLPASEPALIEYPGGFLLHTGLPNPGLSSVLKKYSARWERADLPIIVHLMADRPEETKQMVQMLESIENVMAVELGFAPLLTDDILLITLEMCAGELPLIFSLPHEQVLTVGSKLIQNGAQAISFSAPRGALPASEGQPVSGRLYGRSLFPRTLELTVNAAKLGLPVIAAGGVWTEKDVTDLLSAGAMAVQTDAGLWVPREAVTGTRIKAEERGKF